jgi:uncharacterized protein YbjT (DUF2867 family)
MVRAEADRGRLPAGVEVSVADFDDPASLAPALRGAGRAYPVTPSSERAEAQQRRFADLAVQAGVGHLVVLSSLGGADERSPAEFGQEFNQASRSALIAGAWVVGIPCGNPWYVFSVPFCTSRADSGPESA